MARRYRRLSARPNENEIPTVRITKPRSNPHRRGRRRNAPITKAQARVLKRILRKHGFGVNPVGSDGWYFNYNPKRGTRRDYPYHDVYVGWFDPYLDTVRIHVVLWRRRGNEEDKRSARAYAQKEYGRNGKVFLAPSTTSVTTAKNRAAAKLAAIARKRYPGKTVVGDFLKNNPKRGTRRGKKHHMARKARRVKRNPKPPKGKRAGSVFKRKGKWFRISIVKVKKGRKTVKRRVTRKTTARAAKRARK